MAVLDKVGAGVDLGTVAYKIPHELQVGFVHLCKKIIKMEDWHRAWGGAATEAELTLSGYVRILATCTGTATSSMRRFGSGEMTVLPEKSTLFPERFPRNRPDKHSEDTFNTDGVLDYSFIAPSWRRRSKVLDHQNCTHKYSGRFFHI